MLMALRMPLRPVEVSARAGLSWIGAATTVVLIVIAALLIFPAVQCSLIMQAQYHQANNNIRSLLACMVVYRFDNDGSWPAAYAAG